MAEIYTRQQQLTLAAEILSRKLMFMDMPSCQYQALSDEEQHVIARALERDAKRLNWPIIWGIALCALCWGTLITILVIYARHP